MTGMHIGVNAHLLSFRAGYRRAGVSQYTEQILHRLMRDVPSSGDRLTVYAGNVLPPDGFAPHTVQWRASLLPTERAPARIAWEQCIAPIITARDGLDVLFCPVNVVPLTVQTPTVVTVHDLAFLATPEAFHASKRRYLALMTRRSVRRARRVIAVSAHTKGDLVRHFGVQPEKITVIPNAVETRFRPPESAAEVEAFKTTHGLPDRFILFVGTLEPRKNLRRLIKAFEIIARDDPAIHLAIVGASGWLNSDLAPLVRARGLATRVTFAGYISDEELPRWYQAASVFCYPSLYEGFGLPVLEAMACGTPVVTAATSSLPEVAGGAAILVDPTDTHAIAAGIDDLLGDPARRETLRAAGLARARAFSWERTAAETLTVLRDAAGA